FCQPATCSDAVKNGNETDIDCGGGTCFACAAGKSCSLGSDCQSGICAGGVCQANGCLDGIKDGTETDVDCGGGICTTCPNGKACQGNSDCTSSACNTITLTCVASQCADAHKDGLETDVDCGGGICSACATGKACL